MTSQYAICFSCANIFRIQEKHNEIVCPECSFTVDRDVYERLMKYASEAAQFGYHYRSVYEEDYREKGTLSSRYTLAPLGVGLTFAVIAALSGVIGNISYDLIKKAIQKIKEKLSNTDDISHESSNILDDEKEFKIFILYIEDFHNDFQNVISEIAEAIVEEMVVDKALELETDPESKKDPLYHLLQAKILIGRREKPGSTDFTDFWKGIE